MSVFNETNRMCIENANRAMPKSGKHQNTRAPSKSNAIVKRVTFNQMRRRVESRRCSIMFARQRFNWKFDRKHFYCFYRIRIIGECRWLALLNAMMMLLVWSKYIYERAPPPFIIVVLCALCESARFRPTTYVYYIYIFTFAERHSSVRTGMTRRTAAIEIHRWRRMNCVFLFNR